jgi:hypothetical protein
MDSIIRHVAAPDCERFRFPHSSEHHQIETQSLTFIQ